MIKYTPHDIKQAIGMKRFHAKIVNNKEHVNKEKKKYKKKTNPNNKSLITH